MAARGYCKRRRESVDGQGFLEAAVEKDGRALIVSAGKTHKIKSGCLLNVTEIRTSEIESQAIRSGAQALLSISYFLIKSKGKRSLKSDMIPYSSV